MDGIESACNQTNFEAGTKSSTYLLKCMPVQYAPLILGNCSNKLKYALEI